MLDNFEVSRLKPSSHLFESIIIYKYCFKSLNPDLSSVQTNVLYSSRENDLQTKLIYETIPSFIVTESQTSEYHLFTLTDIDGYFLFGYVKHQQPYISNEHNSIVIISYKPWPQTFYTFSDHIHNVVTHQNQTDLYDDLIKHYPKPFKTQHGEAQLSLNKDHIKYIFKCLDANIIFPVFSNEHPSISPFYESGKYPYLPDSKIMNDLYGCLSVSNIIALWSAVLMERRTILISRRLDKLTHTALACIVLLYPMYWQHIYIPYLPQSMWDALSAPMPYLIGMHSDTFAYYTASHAKAFLPLNSLISLDSLNSNSPSAGSLNSFSGNATHSKHFSTIPTTNHNDNHLVDISIMDILYGADANPIFVVNLDRDTIEIYSDTHTTTSTCLASCPIQNNNSTNTNTVSNNNTSNNNNNIGSKLRRSLTGSSIIGKTNSSFTGNSQNHHASMLNTSPSNTSLGVGSNEFAKRFLLNQLPPYLVQELTQKLSHFHILQNQIKIPASGEKHVTTNITNNMSVSNGFKQYTHNAEGLSSLKTKNVLTGDVKNNQDTMLQQCKIKSPDAENPLKIPIGYALFKVLVSLIGNYRCGLHFEPGHLITFDAQTFIKGSRASVKPCLENIIKTQMFQQFITERLHRLNEGMGFNDSFEMELNESKMNNNASQTQKYKMWLGFMKNEGDFYINELKRKTSQILEKEKLIRGAARFNPFKSSASSSTAINTSNKTVTNVENVLNKANPIIFESTENTDTQLGISHETIHERQNEKSDSLLHNSSDKFEKSLQNHKNCGISMNGHSSTSSSQSSISYQFPSHTNKNKLKSNAKMYKTNVKPATKFYMTIDGMEKNEIVNGFAEGNEDTLSNGLHSFENCARNSTNKISISKLTVYPKNNSSDIRAKESSLIDFDSEIPEIGDISLLEKSIGLDFFSLAVSSDSNQMSDNAAKDTTIDCSKNMPISMIDLFAAPKSHHGLNGITRDINNSRNFNPFVTMVNHYDTFTDHFNEASTNGNVGENFSSDKKLSNEPVVMRQRPKPHHSNHMQHNAFYSTNSWVKFD